MVHIMTGHWWIGWFSIKFWIQMPICSFNLHFDWYWFLSIFCILLSLVIREDVDELTCTTHELVRKWKEHSALCTDQQWCRSSRGSNKVVYVGSLHWKKKNAILLKIMSSMTLRLESNVEWWIVLINKLSVKSPQLLLTSTSLYSSSTKNVVKHSNLFCSIYQRVNSKRWS